MRTQRYHAHLVQVGDEVRSEVDVVVTDGRIAAIEAGRHPQALDLGAVALVPGLVNTHSHAFQRILRGRTEYLHADHPTEDFWSWRDLMYRAALRLDAAAIEAVSCMAFLEMVLSGTTTVGEFHYLQNRPDGTWDPEDPLADRVIRAARGVGLRIALLRVAYARGGFQRPVAAGQRRFIEPDLATFLMRFNDLRDRWRGDGAVTFGLAPHSIRALPAEWLRALAETAQAEGLPLHIHACEQRGELAEARAEYGVEPIAALDGLGILGPHTTLVHGTHLEDDALARIAERGCTVCACPTTEANLGDGFLPATALLAARVPIALGSDSQATLDPWQEARRVEEHARLQAERRSVLAHQYLQWFPAGAGEHRPVADLLWPMLTTHGARALGLPVGRIAVGAPADFVALDLDAPALAGADGGNLVSHLVFSATPGCVQHVWVGGAWVVQDGRHPDQAAIVGRFREVMAGL